MELLPFNVVNLSVILSINEAKCSKQMLHCCMGMFNYRLVMNCDLIYISIQETINYNFLQK